MQKQQVEFLRKNVNDIGILYVEDNKDVREEVSRVLGTFFSNVFVASNGQEGLDIFENSMGNNQINLIITDMEMPKLNGIEMIRQIKNYNSDIPIIITSAFSETDYFLSAIRVGVDDYLVKPITLDKIVDVLIRITNKYFINDVQNLQFDLNWNRYTKELKLGEDKVKLSKNEIKLIDLLVTRKNIVASDLIENYVFDDLESNNKRIRNLISRLNGKLGNPLVESVYGMGYQIKLT